MKFCVAVLLASASLKTAEGTRQVISHEHSLSVDEAETTETRCGSRVFRAPPGCKQYCKHSDALKRDTQFKCTVDAADENELGELIKDESLFPSFRNCRDPEMRRAKGFGGLFGKKSSTDGKVYCDFSTDERWCNATIFPQVQESCDYTPQTTCCCSESTHGMYSHSKCIADTADKVLSMNPNAKKETVYYLSPVQMKENRDGKCESGDKVGEYGVEHQKYMGGDITDKGCCLKAQMKTWVKTQTSGGTKAGGRVGGRTGGHTSLVRKQLLQCLEWEMLQIRCEEGEQLYYSSVAVDNGSNLNLASCPEGWVDSFVLGPKGTGLKVDCKCS